MLRINILLISLLYSISAHTSPIDLLIAKTSLALGDAYLKEAQALESEIMNLLNSNLVNFENRLSLNSPLIEEYEEYRELALKEYENVYCQVNCPEGVDELILAADSNFYRREAYSKAELLLNGALASGVINKRATIYAVNSEFEEHLLGRLYKLVATQQNYDNAARDLNKQLLDLRSAFINNELEIVGVDQNILRETNYTISQQTQFHGYQACVDSYRAQDQFETSEYGKTLEQYEMLQKNYISNLNKIYNIPFSAPGGASAFRVQANQTWMNTGIELDVGEKVAITAAGKWSAKGSALIFNEDHIYRYQNFENTVFFFKAIGNAVKSVVRTVVGTVTGLLGSTLPKQEELVLQEVRASSTNLITRISSQGLDAGPDGYHFSFSNSVSKSSSNNTNRSVSAGISFPIGFGAGNVGGSGGQGSGESLSSSTGTGGTYGLKLTTTPLPESPLGSLIGSFCEVEPSTDPVNCAFFPIESGGIFEIEPPVSGRTLWLRVNDGGLLSSNTGAVSVEIKKSSTFGTYLDEYYEWMEEECDEFGENCGLQNILENIAYISNPFLTVQSLFVAKFPHFPAEVRNLLLSDLNYLVEMNMVQKDLKVKEFGQELNDVKVTHCVEQARLTEQLIDSSRELVRTYSNMTSSVRSRTLLLDAARRFYERELANLNWIRGKNLERIERYYQLTVNAFNYLYFSDYQPVGSLLPYFEGNYYLENIERMRDQIIDITAVNDLLNPNRGFVVYELSKDEMAPLIDTNFRDRETQFRVRLEDVMCRGFGLNDQTRVMIEKVGVLLDLDPAREHLFFTNPHVRNARANITHGSENQFYDLAGQEIEYWMPAQRRRINAWSSQILTDTNSDYQDLRDSRYFDRLSFRKTSFATTWKVDLADASLRMYTQDSVEPILRGVKLVFWFNSTELEGDRPINTCVNPPENFDLKSYDEVERVAELEWTIDEQEVISQNITHFSLYLGHSADGGFKVKEDLELSECTFDSGEYFCEASIDLSDLAIGESAFFKVRSAYKKDNQERLYPGYYSLPLEVVAE